MVLEQFIIDADIIWDQVGKTFFENPEAKPGRIMRVQVVNAGIIEDLTGYTLNLGWTSVRDPSKFGLDAFDDVDITKGIFEIEYTSGMLTNIGPLNASLQLVPPGEGRPIESNNFKLTVKNSAINASAIQGENSFSTLETALVKVNGWNARIDAVEADFIQRANDMEAIYPQQLVSLGSQLEQKPSFNQMEETTGHGYLYGFKVSQQTTANMSIKVENGVMYMPNGDRWVVAINNNLAINAADATNPRKDIVYVNSLGVTSYTAGTPSATPVAPNVPAGGLIIAELYIPANVTAVTDYFITDKKVMKLDNNVLSAQVTANEKRLPIFNAIQIEKMGTYHTDNKYTYTSFFTGANIKGKEVHIGRAGTDHESYDTCLMAYIRNDDGTFTKKKITGIDYTIGDFRDPHISVLTSGAIVMTIAAKKPDASYTNFYVVLDSNLNTLSCQEILGMENHFAWGNCIEQADGSVITCAYFNTNDPLFGVYLFKLVGDGTNTIATKITEIFAPESAGPGESTLSVWGRKLVCVARRNTANLKWRETYDLTGATGWGPVIDLGFIGHAPCIPSVIKEGDPMLLTACYINMGGATTNGRNPYLKIFYDVSEIASSPTILLDDRANNGGYNSLVPNREGYGLMWYQEQALGRTSVYYKEINLASLQKELLLKHVRAEASVTLDWTDITSYFENGWAQSSIPTFARKMSNGNIQIKGQVTGTTFANGTIIATLPAHLRPKYNVYAISHTIGVKEISLVLYPDGRLAIYNVPAAGALLLNTTFVN